MNNDALTRRATFLKGAAVLGAAAAGGVLSGPGEARAAHRGRRGARRAGGGLTYRGVVYDTGTAFGPGWPLTRELWTDALMGTDIRAIDQELHCSAVSVIGTDVDRLVSTATAALERGLQVTVQPRLFDHPQQEVLEHLRRTCREAEKLRLAHRPEVVLAVGCEYVLFTPGIVPGDTFLERIQYLVEGNYDYREITRRLHAFVARAVAVARENFGGRITYAAATGLEEINWNLFDIVGLDYYTFHSDPAEHTRELSPHRRWGKPIMIMEFGCCTYRGAAERGGDGWDVIDYDKPVPEIVGNLVRDEAEQAQHLATMLDVFEAEGFLSASPYQFIATDLPHSPNPRFDLDMASFSLVKVVREDFADPLSPYHWKPKSAYHAVARHNCAAARRQRAAGR
ncbi:hypothetical protein AQ490_02875 [Wenjunlia vitaminophila]|uniref:Abortive phage infection protein n=1 Tax=Wenjunlia vitaminophila TaxID=76728 RepID=A0A0T6LYU7_WENVI|nr:hypothetical protein [Wenjunlia vitaminophila]KRV51152.1 hypothetical protein AQ490_02875 [Wenjunlia vitaminophila]